MKKPEFMENENYESDNYDAGWNAACEEWESWHKEQMRRVLEGLKDEICRYYEDTDAGMDYADVYFDQALKDLEKGE